MKTLILLTVLLFAVPAFCQDTYTAVTKDGEVENIGEVRIKKEWQEPAEEVLTLDIVQSKIDKCDRQIAKWQARKAEWEAIKAKVQTEAEKVTLKPAVISP